MNLYFLTAGILTVLLGIIHSILGEKLIFQRLSQADPIPSPWNKTLSGQRMRSIRSSWHLVSFFGWGIAAILLRMSFPATAGEYVIFAKNTFVVTFFITAIYWFIGTRGKHPAWIILLLIGVLTWMA